MSEIGQYLEGSLKCYMKMYDKVFRENHDLRAKLAKAQEEAYPAYKREKALRCKAEFELAEAQKEIERLKGEKKALRYETQLERK